MAGFVFFPKSPRHIALETARTLGDFASGKIAKVALTVDAEDAALLAIIEALRPDFLQLHGSETPERTREIRARFGIPVIKGNGISAVSDVAAALAASEDADWMLLDAKPPEGSDLPGGNGTSFDWEMLRAMYTTKPWLLSGGLNAENVRTAILMTRAPGIDVSSGVEIAPGIKDADKIGAFVTMAKVAELPS